MNGKTAKKLRRAAEVVFYHNATEKGNAVDLTTKYFRDSRGVIGVAPTTLRFVYLQFKKHHNKGVS